MRLTAVRITLFQIAMLFLLTGCAAWRGIPLSQVPTRVGPGDRVRVTTLDGRSLELEVVALENGDLVSYERRVPLNDLALVEERRARTAPEDLAGALLVVVGALALLVVVA